VAVSFDSLPEVFEAACSASESVRDAVFFSAASAVGTCDPLDEDKMPAVGVIETKPTATTCVVRRAGSLGGFTGLVPGKKLFVAEDGALEHAPIARPVTDLRYVQSVAVAQTPTSILVLVDTSMVKIRP